MTAVEIETTHAVELMERIETLESVARSLPEGDERRSQLLDLVEKDLTTAAPLRPRVVARLLGLSLGEDRPRVGRGGRSASL